MVDVINNKSQMENLCREYCQEAIIKSRNEDYVITNFYRTIPDVDSLKLVEEPDQNFTNYMLFSLTSYLNSWISLKTMQSNNQSNRSRNGSGKGIQSGQIKNKWSDDIYLTFPGYQKDNKLYLTVKPFIGGNEFQMTREMKNELQEYVNSLTITNFRSVLLFNYSSIFDPESDTTIPESWVKEFLPYVDIKKELNPFINKYGLFVQIGNFPDYSTIHQRLSISVEEALLEMYKMGAVLLPSAGLIRDWELVTDDYYQEVYYPVWTDLRITKTSGTSTSSKQQFMQDRINGIKTIDYEVGENKILQHAIIRYILNKYPDKEETIEIRNRRYLRVKVDNLQEAQKIASLIDMAEEYSSGFIHIKYVTSIDDVKIYQEIAEVNSDIIKYQDVVVYKTDDIYRPYNVSFLFSYESNINMNEISYLLWKTFRDYRLDLNLERDQRIIKGEEIIEVEGLKDEEEIPLITFDVDKVPFPDVDELPEITVPTKYIYAEKYVDIKEIPRSKEELREFERKAAIKRLELQKKGLYITREEEEENGIEEEEPIIERERMRELEPVKGKPFMEAPKLPGNGRMMP